MNLRCQNRALFGEALIVGRRTVLVSSDGLVVGLEIDEALRLLQDHSAWIVERGVETTEPDLVAEPVSEAEPVPVVSTPSLNVSTSAARPGKMKPLIFKEK